MANKLMGGWDISIVIPFFNEKKSLEILIPRLLKVVSQIDKKIEIIFVDDASTDGSGTVAAKYAEKNENIKILSMGKRSGQTGAYKEAFRIAKGEYIIRMDSDLQDSPEDLPKFIEKINEGYDLIMGLREARKHSKILRLASGLYDLLIVLFFNSPLHSNSGSFVCFKKEYVQNIPWKKNDHRYLPIIAMTRGAKKVGEVLVKHTERKYGESKYRPYKKLIFGFPEAARFFIRVKRGYYNRRR